MYRIQHQPMVLRFEFAIYTRPRNKRTLVTKRVSMIPRHVSAPPAEFSGPLYGTVGAGEQREWPVDRRRDGPASPSITCKFVLGFMQILDIENASALRPARPPRQTFRRGAAADGFAPPSLAADGRRAAGFNPKALTQRNVY
jgi:hypothetical protein